MNVQVTAHERAEVETGERRVLAESAGDTRRYSSQHSPVGSGSSGSMGMTPNQVHARSTRPSGEQAHTPRTMRSDAGWSTERLALQSFPLGRHPRGVVAR